MPYIAETLREKVSPIGYPAHTVGELNFQITMIILGYVKHWGLSYSHINDVLGALEGAKLEFYRRVAVPYENQKIEDNGDVYPVELTQGGQK